MPELPEVETIKNDLEKKIIGLKIKDVVVYDDRVIKDLQRKIFIERLKGQRFSDVLRRGKALILSFQKGGFLVIQLKMTGQLIYSDAPLCVGRNPDPDARFTRSGSRLSESERRDRAECERRDTDAMKRAVSKETRVIFKFSNNRYLCYNDQRLFGRLSLVDDLNEVSYLKTIGPEPLNDSFGSDRLAEHLKQRKASIKTLLMNQHFLAGIGNIYASEILFSAHLDPTRPANDLTRIEIQNLHKIIIEVLKKAIYYRGTSMRNYRDTAARKGRFINHLKVYGREGQPCVMCGLPIKRLVQNARSTFFCSHCQS